MSRYAQRLSRVAKVFGCCVHSEALVCRSCQPPEPFPQPVAQGMIDLVDRITARVPRELLAEAARRAGRPPVQEPCTRCGIRQTCMRCEVRYGLALLHHIGLTDSEQAWLESMIETCRQIDERP